MPSTSTETQTWPGDEAPQSVMPSPHENVVIVGVDAYEEQRYHVGLLCVVLYVAKSNRRCSKVAEHDSVVTDCFVQSMCYSLCLHVRKVPAGLVNDDGSRMGSWLLCGVMNGIVAVE